MGTGKIIQADNIDGLKTVKNFISNGNATLNTSGWVTYKDAAGTRPVDGTGGSPTLVTFTRTTTSPLDDAASFLFTVAGGSSAQGEGASFGFTIGSAYKAKVLKIEADYIVNSGTFAAGSNTTASDVIVYIYDVTNGVLIEPSSFKFLSNSSTISDKFSATFQTASNSTSYRLILHVASASTQAYSLKFDNLAVSPVVSLNIAMNGPVGSIIATGSLTPPTGYLYANGSAVSRTTYSELFKVIGTTYGVGDGSTTFNLPDLRGVFARGAGSQTIGAETYSATLGQKQNDATSKNGLALTDPGHSHQYDMSGSGNSNSLWHPNPNNGWGSNSFASALYNDSLYGRFSDHIVGSGSNVSLNNGDAETRPANVAVAYHICFNAGSVQVSDGYDGRVVAVSAYGSGSITSGTTPNILNLGTTVVDKTNSLASNTFTVPSAGDYSFTAHFQGNSASGQQMLSIFVDGIEQTSFTSQISMLANGQRQTISGILPLKSDQLVTIRGWQNSGSAVNMNSSFNIQKLAGNPVISATETVGALYTGAPPTGTLGAAFNPVTFGTKVKDSHGAYSGGVYTIQATGQYDITASSIVTHVSVGVGNTIAIAIQVDSVNAYASQLIVQNTSVLQYNARVEVKAVPLRAGQTIRIVMFDNGTSPSYMTEPTYNFFSITRSGGY